MPYIPPDKVNDVVAREFFLRLAEHFDEPVLVHPYVVVFFSVHRGMC